MPEDRDGLPHDKEAHTSPWACLGSRRLEASNILRHLFLGDADAAVENVDPHTVLKLPAAYEDSAAQFGLFYSVADQIAKDRAEQQRITHDPGRG